MKLHPIRNQAISQQRFIQMGEENQISLKNIPFLFIRV